MHIILNENLELCGNVSYWVGQSWGREDSILSQISTIYVMHITISSFCEFVSMGNESKSLSSLLFPL